MTTHLELKLHFNKITWLDPDEPEPVGLHTVHPIPYIPSPWLLDCLEGYIHLPYRWARLTTVQTSRGTEYLLELWAPLFK